MVKSLIMNRKPATYGQERKGGTSSCTIAAPESPAGFFIKSSKDKSFFVEAKRLRRNTTLNSVFNLIQRLIPALLWNRTCALAMRECSLMRCRTGHQLNIRLLSDSQIDTQAAMVNPSTSTRS